MEGEDKGALSTQAEDNQLTLPLNAGWKREVTTR